MFGNPYLLAHWLRGNPERCWLQPTKAHLLHERKNDVLAAARGRKGQQWKCAVANGFDGLLRVRTWGGSGLGGS